MEIKNIHTVYFIGIGGIGMSALATYFLSLGKKVAGYDKTATNITQTLQKQGAVIHFKEDVNEIPVAFKDKKNTLIVYTPAIPKTHKELAFFISNGFVVVKRSEVLGKITEHTFCLAVAGTHGKTTTTAILGHILKQTVNATAFLGGISENYQSNLILGNSEVSVVEADEFDRSFLQLSPDIACVTSMDADHLDIYKNKEELHKSFREFSEKVTKKIIVHKSLPLLGTTYAINDNEADFEATNIKIDKGGYVFDVRTPKETLKNVWICLPGKHNVLNTLAALAMAYSYGVSLKDIKKALGTFKGIKRRFSYQINTEKKVLIDDYAHHPTEIEAVANAISEMYPNKKVTAVFQPHLYSRTKDFVEDFAKALAKFDSLLLLDIYPAREKPMEGVTSQWLLEKIKTEKKQLTSKEELFKNIQKINPEVLVILGAGDIGEMVEDIKIKWSEK